MRRTIILWLAIAGILATLAPLGLGLRSAYATPSIDPRFVNYYNAHQGVRVLGYPITELMEMSGYAAQLFEKGAIEDHRAEVREPGWQFMYARLTALMMGANPQGKVSSTDMTYGELAAATDPGKRVAPPENHSGGVKGVNDGMFVPFDPYLRRAPGYVVAPYFWAYMNRPELFPGGWLHDLGLPMTGVMTTKVMKQGEQHNIFVQAFERAVLTYDMRNPTGWQVEKGNIGSDSLPFINTKPPASTTPTPNVSIEVPQAGARVMLPLHILARAGKPGAQVQVLVRWQDGTRLLNSFTLLEGEHGGGLLIGNVDWINSPNPPQPATQPATIQIMTQGGVVLAERQVVIVGAKDPSTAEVKVYWSVSGTEIVQPQVRRVIGGPGVATRTLEELLWGPPTISQVGFQTSLPTPQMVLSYPGREPDWGPRVTLRGLTIVNGVATADFSKEMKAYGGGSLRVKMIRDQITMTLKQFTGVREVRIAIEGQTEAVLEP